MTSLQLVTPVTIFLTASIAVLLWGRFYEPYAYQKSLYKLRVKKRIPGGLRILHLTDLHFRRERQSLTRFFDELAKENYDFVFLTGDIIDHLSCLPYAVENLKKLRARLGYFGVLGNHDYLHYRIEDLVLYYLKIRRRVGGYERARKIKGALEEAGIRILHNQTVKVVDGAHTFLIHGADDPVTGQARPELLEVGSHGSCLEILLTHTVDLVRQIDMQTVDLSFSGHSHGGQVKLPGIGALVTHTEMGREYADGIVQYEKHTQCVIGRGLGSNRFIPFRLLCLPEVIMLELNESSSEVNSADRETLRNEVGAR